MGEAGRVEVIDVERRPHADARTMLTVVTQVVEVPQHEAPVAEEPVDIAEERLALVHGIELDLGLDDRDGLEDALRAAQARSGGGRGPAARPTSACPSSARNAVAGARFRGAGGGGVPPPAAVVR